MRWAFVPLFLITGGACAQVYFGNRIGVSIGKQLLNDRAPLRTGPDYGYEAVGFNAGATLELPITDRSSLQAELGYVEKGYQADEFTFWFTTVPEQLFRLGYGDM